MSTDTAIRATGVEIRRLAPDRPWIWLQRGWDDLVAAWRTSLAYGVSIVLLSWGLAYALWMADSTWLVLPMAGGFLLIAPFVAIGLYDVSRRREAGETTSVTTSFRTALKRPHVAAFGLVLLLLHFAWMRAAMLWFVLYFHTGTPPLHEIPLYMFQPVNLPFLLIGTIMGGGFAIVTFAISIITLPIMLDRQLDVVSAILASLRCVVLNPKAAALWAALIAVFTFAGLATFFFGLGLLFPLVAHASWHAYRDMTG